MREPTPIRSPPLHGREAAAVEYVLKYARPDGIDDVLATIDRFAYQEVTADQRRRRDKVRCSTPWSGAPIRNWRWSWAPIAATARCAEVPRIHASATRHAVGYHRAQGTPG